MNYQLRYKKVPLTFSTEFVLLARNIESFEAVVTLEPFAPYAVMVHHTHTVHLLPTVHTANHPTGEQDA